MQTSNSAPQQTAAQLKDVCNYFFDREGLVATVPALRRVERIALYGERHVLSSDDLDALATLRTITDALEDTANGKPYFINQNPQS